MKNFNLIKRLWTDSHEKQSPQRFARYAAMLFLLLTFGVGQTSAIGFREGNIFFDATGWSTTDHVYFVVGHDSWSSTYELSTHVANTNLYRGWCSNGDWWSGCNYFAVLGSGSTFSTGGWGYSNVTNAACYTGKYTSAYDINSSNIYVLKPASSTNGAAFDIEYQADITGLNTTQTLTVQGKAAGAGSYSNAANCYGTTVSATTHYFNTAWDSADQNGAINLTSTTASGDVTAAFTSTVSLSLTGTPTTGYQFDGWYYSDGTLLSNSTTTSYIAKGATTVYARFSEKNYTVTYTAGAGGSVTTPATSSSTVGQVTGVSVVAAPTSGYSFNGWTIETGTGTFANAANASTTFYPSSAATIQANFVADAEETHDVTVSYKCGATSIKDNTTESAVGVETSRSVTAPAITGYTFSSWTLGDGLTNNSANTTTNPISIVTKASGSYTLTANYTINSHNVIFNANGGTGSMSNESFNYNQTKALTSNTLTRTGYVFKGWATSSARATAGTIDYTDGADYTMGDADVTLYAVWFKKVYFVNADGWTAANVKAHAFTGSTSWKTWNDAAEVMTSTGTTVFGYTIYSYEFPETYTTVIFHNNGNSETKTADQTWTAATPYCYYKSGAGTQYASVAAIREAWKVYGSWNKTGESWNSNDFTSYGENSATYTVDLAAATTYNFKYVFAGTNSWYGSSGSNMSDGDTWTLNGGQNVTFTTTVAGTYTLTITYSGMSANNAPSCTVTFPTTHTVTYAVVPEGASLAITTSPSVSSGSEVIDGTSITFTRSTPNTGYTWLGWYNNTEGSGIALGTENTYTQSITADATIYAVYLENNFEVTVSAGANGTVSPSGAVSVKRISGTELTATPNSYYVFKDWTISGGGLEAKSPSTLTSNPATFTATALGGTIQANFAPQWAIAGGLSRTRNGESDAMGDWDVYTNGIVNLGTNASSQDTGYVNITLPANTTFYFKVTDIANNTWYGNTGTMNYAANNKQAWDMSTGVDQECGIVTAAAGTYKFAWNITAKKVTVTYPVSYTLSYNIGTVAGTDGEISVSPSLTSGQYAASGDVVTLTAPAPKAGYAWKGWYTDAAGTTGKINDTERAISVTMNANKSLYACYDETLYTVTVTAGANGTVGAASVSAGPTTAQTITATANDGYFFSSWEVLDGSATIANASSATTTVTATSDAIIRANFIADWVIAGIGSWDIAAHGFDHFGTNANSKDTCYIDMVLEANTNYTYKVVKIVNTDIESKFNTWYGNNTTTQYMNYVANNKQVWNFGSDGGNSANCGLTTAGAGTYRFVWNITDKSLYVIFPTSYTVTFGYGTGGSAVTATVEDATTITSGQYAAAGKDVTFAATPATGYSLKGWYTTADGETAVTGMGAADNVLDDITADAVVYAQFAENLTSVKVSANEIAGGTVTVDGEAHTWNSNISVGVVTTHSVAVTAADGYYFAGWTLSDGADFTTSGTGEADATITVTGLGAGETTGQVLTANFVELNKVYFRNIFDDGVNEPTSWENVYVYYNAYWDSGDKGAGANGCSYAQMTQIGSSNIYEAYIPRAVSTGGVTAVAFSNVDFHEYFNFNGGMAVYRNDYNNNLNMFVPNHVSNETKNTTTYYSSGYWMRYNSKGGEGIKYYLHRTSGVDIDFEFKATEDGSNIGVDTLRIDHLDAKVYYVGGANGQNYYPTANITTENSTVTLSTTNSGYTLTPTSEGVYTFYLSQENDEMVLTVDYPAAVGDYRLVYTNTALGGKIRTTDIIKNRNKEGYVTTMFIDEDAAGAVLKLQKCTAISDRKPVWTDAGGTGATTLLTAFEGKEPNVYKFTIDIADAEAGNVETSATCSISSIEVYGGPFYIKTDCANGGWASFTANEMEENTVNYDGTDNTYNYYYCKWVDGITESFKMNMKFVIATDYNNAVSDTISETPEEDFLVSNGYKKELLPEDANVRFSFNTKTCTAKRAYILGSTYLETFIWLQPNTTGNVYNYVKYGNGITDMYSVDDANRKFKDNGNWTYQMDVELKPNAKAGVKVRYPSWSSSTTYLVPQTTELIGSSNNGQYDFRLVYDFKTNHLIAAWIAGEISENLTLDANVLMIREAQDANKTNVIILNKNTILNTDTAYGAIEFKRDAMVGQLNTLEKIYEQCLYYISFPFDVKVSDVIGIGKRGVDWNLYKYNGTKRAEVGWFLGDGHETFWETMSGDDVMHAYEGYCLGLEETHFNDGANAVWTNISAGGSTFIYFPSSDKIGDIENGTKTITVPAHICEIDQYYKQDKENYPDNPEKWRNHKITDSNWNVIGSPLFANGTMKSFVVNAEVDEDRQLKYYYAWDHTTGNWSPLTNNANWMITEHGTEMTDNAQTFNAMFGYFVQFAGTVTFEGAMQKEEPVVARRKAAPQNYAMSLELSRGSKKENRAFVELREGANDDFMLDEDMCLMASSNADIYTYAGAYDAMANVLSMDDHTVRVGVDIKTAGEYTFSMPVMFDGTAVLVDLLTGTRTNLALSDYTVSLNKGMYNDRFVLEIGARKIVTSLDATDLKDGNVHKFVENGVMYILRDGKRYDAQGKVVNN